jgi:hypothetical protein
MTGVGDERWPEEEQRRIELTLSIETTDVVQADFWRSL